MRRFFATALASKPEATRTFKDIMIKEFANTGKPIKEVPSKYYALTIEKMLVADVIGGADRKAILWSAR